MLIRMTQNQKSCLESALRTMEPFYRNELEPLCIQIGHCYNIPDENIHLAAGIIKSLPKGVTSPIPQKTNELHVFSQKMLNGGMVQVNENWTIELNDSEQRLLAHTLDVYSRLLMGQLHMIFEELDIDIPDNPHLLDFWRDARWNGAGGMIEVRNLLFPDLKSFGWNGGYGISNPKVAFFSRLAYQMKKALLNPNDFILPVTDEPPLTIQT